MKEGLIQLNTADLAEFARETAERAARKAVHDMLREFGLVDEDGHIGDAIYDVRDMRDFIQLFRKVKRRITLWALAIVLAALSPIVVPWLGRHL